MLGLVLESLSYLHDIFHTELLRERLFHFDGGGGGGGRKIFHKKNQDQIFPCRTGYILLFILPFFQIKRQNRVVG